MKISKKLKFNLEYLIAKHLMKVFPLTLLVPCLIKILFSQFSFSVSSPAFKLTKIMSSLNCDLNSTAFCCT